MKPAGQVVPHFMADQDDQDRKSKGKSCQNRRGMCPEAVEILEDLGAALGGELRGQKEARHERCQTGTQEENQGQVSPPAPRYRLGQTRGIPVDFTGLRTGPADRDVTIQGGVTLRSGFLFLA